MNENSRSRQSEAPLRITTRGKVVAGALVSTVAIGGILSYVIGVNTYNNKPVACADAPIFPGTAKQGGVYQAAGLALDALRDLGQDPDADPATVGQDVFSQLNGDTADVTGNSLTLRICVDDQGNTDTSVLPTTG